MLQAYSPIGFPAAGVNKARRNLDSLHGKKIGFLWNQYNTTQRFWPRFEEAVVARNEPGAVLRAYKENTWTPLAGDKLREFLLGIDCAVVGVGA